MSARLARTLRIERRQHCAKRRSIGPDRAALNEMNAAPAVLVALPPAGLDPQAGQPAGSREIERLHGCHVFPDVNSLGQGEDPHWLYTVRFDGCELWGKAGDPTLSVSVDAWEPYLEPA